MTKQMRNDGADSKSAARNIALRSLQQALDASVDKTRTAQRIVNEASAQIKDDKINRKPSASEIASKALQRVLDEPSNKTRSLQQEVDGALKASAQGRPLSREAAGSAPIKSQERGRGPSR